MALDQQPSDNLTYATGQWPSPLLPKEQMNDKKTGRAVASAIYETSIYGSNSYYSIRNSGFAKNRVFAVGKQPFQSYLDLLGADGKASFANYDYHPRPVAPKFRAILVNDIMSRMESIDCTALSQSVQQRKDDRKNEMAFKMKHGDFIKQAEQTAGMKLSDDSEDFTPESEDELQLWSDLHDKEREETLMAEGIDFIMYNNDQASIKKEVAEDLVDTGLACELTYLDGRNRVRCKRIRPEYLVYGTTLTLNFRNIPYVGHLERLSILDVRAMYPDYDEQKLYDLAYMYRGQFGNPDQLVDFIVDFQIAYTRPYDSWLVDVLFFKYRVLKTIDYTKGMDRNGNPIFEYRKSSGENPNKQPYKTQIPTWYQGAWLIGATDTMEWHEMPNLIRNNEDVEDVSSGYAIYMLNNNGDMLPVSPMEMISSSIVQMDLSILRMQQVIATTPPNGIKMDIDAIMDVDMGKGIGKVGPMKMREIYTQMGDVYYSGAKISGEKGNTNPIEQMISNFGDKLKSYIEVYNFELNCIRDYLGINEVKDGSEVNPRLGLGVMQGQMQASNMSTAHIYGGYVSILTDTAKSIAILLWDLLNTPTTNDMYIRLLGKENADFIKYNKDITKSNYLTKISVNMSTADLSWIDNMCMTAVQQKQMLPDDAMMVKKYSQFNMEYAIRYLTFIQKKRAKEAQQAQQQAAQQQQQATAQLAQQQQAQKEQQDAASDKREMTKVSTKGNIDHTLSIQDLINQSLLLEQQGKGAIPKYVQIAIDKQLAAHIQEQESQIESMQNELQEHDLAMTQMVQQQAEQQQGQPEGQGQEQAA